MRRSLLPVLCACAIVAGASACGGSEPPVVVETVTQTPSEPIAAPAPPEPGAAAPTPEPAPSPEPAPTPQEPPAADPTPAGPASAEPPVAADTEASPAPEPPSTPASGVTLQDLFDEVPGPNVKLVLGVSDLAVGDNRVSFLVVRGDGSLVQAPRARVRVGRIDATGDVADASTIDGATLSDGEADLEPVGPHSHGADRSEPHDHVDATDVYAMQLTLDEPGRYWVLVDPEGEKIQGYDVIEVRSRPLAPAVGDEAYPSENPTIETAPAEQITTADPPDTELLRYTIKDSLAEGVPFVVVFATPAFCVSRVCGPTVEVVDAVRERLADSGVRFIHVEVYQDNDPSNGFNQWVGEWHLPTEPWTFLVDERGIIVDRIEGAISVDSLEALVREKLPATG